MKQIKIERNFYTLRIIKKRLQMCKGGFVSFGGMAEPFHNPQCADMIKYTYEKGYRVYLFTTLMGMTLEDFEKIKDVKFDFFELHIPDKQNNCHFVIDNIYKELLVKMQSRFHTYSYSCHGDVHPEIESLIDATKRAGLILGDRAGNLDIGMKRVEREAPFLCAHGFEDMLNQWIPVMCPDGTLVACCNDYGMRHQFGNLINDSWDHISKQQEFQRFRQSWEDNTVKSLCNHCGSAVKIDQLPYAKLAKVLAETDQLQAAGRLKPQHIKLIQQLSNAGEILIWGTGTYYKDHYKYFGWDRVLRPTAVLDSNKENRGTLVDGGLCYLPQEYRFKKNSLVILFAKNTKDMEAYLRDREIQFICIDDIFCAAASI